MNLFPLFGDAVAFTKINVDNNKVLNILKQTNFKIRKQKLGSMVSDTFNFLERCSFLEKEINKILKDYIFNVLRQNTDFQYTTSWATKTTFGNKSDSHAHGNSWLSGVYYPMGDKSFKIKLHSLKPTFWSDRVIDYNIYNSRTWTFDIEDNHLIIFPSFVPHEILTNNSKQDRYSIAFNIIPKGTMYQNTDSEITL